MEIILLIFLIGSVGINLILLFVLFSRQSTVGRKKGRISNFDQNNQGASMPQKLETLLRDPDPLGELVRFYHLAENGNTSLLKQAPDVLEFFFSELSKRWQLDEIGPYNCVVPYNPSIHRSLEQIPVGTPVIIYKPGWMLSGKTIKHAIVHISKGR